MLSTQFNWAGLHAPNFTELQNYLAVPSNMQRHFVAERHYVRMSELRYVNIALSFKK